MIKLLAVDMDGTCLNEKHRMSEETLSALREAAEAGILVVPTTGRTTTCLPTQLAGEHFYRYVISSNGADVTDLQTGESLYEALIPLEEAEQVLRQCRERGLGISAHLNHHFRVEGRPLHTLGKICFGREAAHAELSMSVEQELLQPGCKVEELQIFYFSKKKAAAAREIFSAAASLQTAYSGVYLESYGADASKGKALKALAERLNIPREQVACIGDAENDLSMFEAAGLRFAMGNAIEELKAGADVILPTNEESGVAYAIRQHLLGKN